MLNRQVLSNYTTWPHDLIYKENHLPFCRAAAKVHVDARIVFAIAL